MVFSCCSSEATLRNSASLDAFRWRTKSTMPSLYLKVWDILPSGRSSTKRISRPLLRHAITCSRSITVLARNSPVGAGPPPRGLPGALELADGLAAVLELEHVVVAVPIDLQDQPGGQ